MFKKITIAASILVSACASRPASISASFVSHEKYVAGDCILLTTQMSNAKAELVKVSSEQNIAANIDAVSVFLVLIPFSKLAGDRTADVAKAKGVIEAIETAQAKNNCNA